MYLRQDALRTAGSVGAVAVAFRNACTPPTLLLRGGGGGGGGEGYFAVAGSLA